MTTDDLAIAIARALVFSGACDSLPGKQIRFLALDLAARALDEIDRLTPKEKPKTEGTK
jgi:hypothetical protein